MNLADLSASAPDPAGARSWVSYGVCEGTDTDGDTPVVDFSSGQPLVRVMLHPDLIPAYCRVGMAAGGNGEAEWHPFIAGDEVIVVIPEGNPRSGPVIVGRLTNEIDLFPVGSVGGQDPTKNNFSFKRTRTPYVQEHAGPVLIRSALTGAMLSMDETGVITLRGGGSTAGDPTSPAPGFQMGPDVIGFQDATGKYALQMSITNATFGFLVGDATFSLSGSDAKNPQNMMGVPGSFALATAGNPPLEHVATAESVANILANALTILAAAFTATGITPLTGATAGTIIETFATVGFPAALTAAAATPLLPTILAAITAAFAAAPPKPNTPGTGQLAPGLGAVGTLTG